LTRDGSGLRLLDPSPDASSRGEFKGRWRKSLSFGPVGRKAFS